MAKKRSKGRQPTVRRGTARVDVQGVRSELLRTIVREIARTGIAAEGTYTKPDTFQNGSYGKYEKQD